MPYNTVSKSHSRIKFIATRYLVVLLFLTLSSGAFAQLKEKIDSLHTAFVQAEADSAKCDILTQIAEEYRFINSDSSIAYVNKAKEIAKTLQSDYMDVDIAILNAIVLYEKGDYENSIRLLKEIDPLATKLGDKGGWVHDRFPFLWKTSLRLYRHIDEERGDIYV